MGRAYKRYSESRIYKYVSNGTLLKQRVFFVNSIFIFVMHFFYPGLANNIESFGTAEIKYTGIFNESIYEQSLESFRAGILISDPQLAKNPILVKNIVTAFSIAQILTQFALDCENQDDASDRDGILDDKERSTKKVKLNPVADRFVNSSDFLGLKVDSSWKDRILKISDEDISTKKNEIWQTLLDRNELEQINPTSISQVFNIQLDSSCIQNKKLALRFGKLYMIEKHFAEKLLHTNEYINFVKSQKESPINITTDIIKGIAHTFVGMISFNSMAMQIIEKYLPFDNKQINDTHDQLKKRVHDLLHTKYELENGIENENISVLEQEYIANKLLIPPFLQNTIETMLIRIRDEPYEISQKIEIVKNALNMPYALQTLNVKEIIKCFNNSEFFKVFDDELREKLREIIIKICIDSEGKTEELCHKTTCYLHGPTGSGKTSAVREIAKLLDLPLFEITINDLSDLSRNNVNGVRGYPSSSPGWLAEALMKKNAKMRRVVNAILLLNDFDKVLFQGSNNRPNSSALNLLLDLLDPEKRFFDSGYFQAETPIIYLNIFVTSNRPLPKFDNTSENYNDFAALISRVDIVEFKGFPEDKLESYFCEKYLDKLLIKYQLENDTTTGTFINTAIAQQKAINGDRPIELRDLKKRLEKLVIKHYAEKLSEQM